MRVGKRRSGKGEQGLTITELIMVMAILAVIGVIVAPKIVELTSGTGYMIDRAAKQIAADIRYAQELAVSQHHHHGAIIGILAQRLVRTIYPGGRSRYVPDEKILRGYNLFEERNEIPFEKGKGCKNCRQTGYRGRTGIFELMLINEGEGPHFGRGFYGQAAPGCT